MARIVTTYYRYRRPPKKKRTQPALAQMIVTATRKTKRAKVMPEVRHDADRKSAIVTMKPRRSRFGDVPDMTPEEHRRRGDAADELWRELVRRVREQ